MRTRPLAPLALALGLTVSACSKSDSTPTTPTKQLDVMSWWTSGSESAALTVLFDAYGAAFPGVKVQNGAVAGGGGSNVQVVLAERLRKGDPPDVWQTFAGASLKEYVRRGLIRDVSSVYAADGLANQLPAQILDAVTVDGKQYGVPTGAHRSNMLWFNSAALTKAGIATPGDGYTTAEWVADLGKAKKAGVTPLCMGGEAFASAELFEDILLSQVGPDGWTSIGDDKFDWSGDKAKAALKTFGQALDQADAASGGMTWDAATKKLAKGDCAFEAFNDSAYGELVNAGAKEGTDFGGVAFPGTTGSYVAVVDTFVAGKGAANGANALDFLKVIGTAQTELGFNKIKGSVPLRSDVPVTSLTTYEQSAAKSLREDKLLLSIVHGSAMSPAFQQGFYDAVSAYVKGRDAKAFASTLAEAVNQGAQVNNH